MLAAPYCSKVNKLCLKHPALAASSAKLLLFLILFSTAHSLVLSTPSLSSIAYHFLKLSQHFYQLTELESCLSRIEFRNDLQSGKRCELPKHLHTQTHIYIHIYSFICRCYLVQCQLPNSCKHAPIFAFYTFLFTSFAFANRTWKGAWLHLTRDYAKCLADNSEFPLWLHYNALLVVSLASL